jgi:meiosis-specific APC/C activator protein AMA1
MLTTGIAISPDLAFLAVGSNDNYVSIWELRHTQQPGVRFRIKHKSAVKALAFCPWAPSLLATGGGTYDKTIRFWHSQSGTLIKSRNLHGQITGIIWSEHYRQLAVAIGFGKREKSSYMGIYSFPELQLIAHVPHIPGVRALSAAPSCDKTSIVIASSDQTVRFYQIWEMSSRIVRPWYGVYGSDILEFLEGREDAYGVR